MDDQDLSYLPTLIRGLTERMQDLRKEFETLYVKIQLTQDLWHKIKHLYQQETKNSLKEK